MALCERGHYLRASMTATSPNFTEAAQSGRQERAALLVAEDMLTDEQIAAEVGVTKRSIEFWKKRPEFAARVTQHREEFKNRALTEGFADKRARIAALNAFAQDLSRDMAQPGDDLKPRGTYRLEKKISANGEVIEYEVFDKAKADTFRGYLDDIAAEMGERTAAQPAVFQSLVSVIVGVEVDRL